MEYRYVYLTFKLKMGSLFGSEDYDLLDYLPREENRFIPMLVGFSPGSSIFCSLLHVPVYSSTLSDLQT